MIPESVEILRIFVACEDTTDDESSRHITPLVDRIIQLPNLKQLYFSVPEILKTDDRRLTAFLLESDIRVYLML